jgi:mono/diheme cytochrome c family protein
MLMKIKKIHPIFVITAPVMVLVSCAQYRSDVPAAPTMAGQPVPAPAVASVTAGRKLFLKNCATCHAADAHGDEGPDLHDLDWTDQQIATRIRNGKKGAMTSFAGKLQSPEIDSLIAYVRTLK